MRHRTYRGYRSFSAAAIAFCGRVVRARASDVLWEVTVVRWDSYVRSRSTRWETARVGGHVAKGVVKNKYSCTRDHPQLRHMESWRSSPLFSHATSLSDVQKQDINKLRKTKRSPKMFVIFRSLLDPVLARCNQTWVHADMGWRVRCMRAACGRDGEGGSGTGASPNNVVNVEALASHVDARSGSNDNGAKNNTY